MVRLFKNRYKPFMKAITLIVLVAFCLTSLPSYSYAQGLLGLPAPGTPVPLSSGFIPTILRGIRTYPNNPFEFDFIVDAGDAKLEGEAFNKETEKLVKYFLASLTVPEEDLWVNLSPYEKDRIVPESFGQTEMGRDLLAQDYLLKQITASLINPDTDLGKEFWSKIYKKAYEQFGTTNIPVNTFNKVWIVPQKAVVYENGDKAFIVESRLRVMLEEDYVALQAKQQGDSQKYLVSSENQPLNTNDQRLKTSTLSSSIVREIVIPELEKEVNEGKNFVNLRQIYNSLILATWFKETLKNSIINRKYSDQRKVKGLETSDSGLGVRDSNNENRTTNNVSQVDQIYSQYLAAYKKGVCDIMKVEYDPYARKAIPRKYFSGGMQLKFGKGLKGAFQRIKDSTLVIGIKKAFQNVHLKFQSPSSGQAGMFRAPADAISSAREEKPSSGMGFSTRQTTKKNRLKHSLGAIKELFGSFQKAGGKRIVIYDIGIGWANRHDGPATTVELAEALGEAEVFGIDNQIPRYVISLNGGVADAFFDGHGRILSYREGNSYESAQTISEDGRKRYEALFQDLYRKASRAKMQSGKYVSADGNILEFQSSKKFGRSNLKLIDADLFDLSALNKENVPLASIVRISNVLIPHYELSQIKDALVSLLPHVEEGGLVLIGFSDAMGFPKEESLVYQKTDGRFELTKYLFSVRADDNLNLGNDGSPVSLFNGGSLESKMSDLLTLHPQWKDVREFIIKNPTLYYEKYPNDYDKAMKEFDADARIWEQKLASFLSQKLVEEGFKAQALGSMVEVAIEEPGAAETSLKNEFMEKIQENYVAKGTPKAASSTLEGKEDLSKRTVKIGDLQNVEKDEFYIDPEQMQIFTEVNTTLKKLSSLTEEDRGKELKILFSQIRSSEIFEPRRIAISIILARQNVTDYKKEAIWQLLKYIHAKKGNLSDDHVRNSRLLSFILEELAHHYRRSSIAWSEDLAQEVGQALQWWLMDAWGSLPSISVLLALYSKPGFNLRDAVVGEGRIGQFLEEKGIDIATIKSLLTKAKLNISKQRYHHWDLDVSQALAAQRSGQQRQPFLATMLSPASREILDQRLRELENGGIPGLLIATLLKEKGISEDEIVSMYVTGSYLWGDEINRPTDLDIYVITSKNIEDRIRIPLSKDLFSPGFARAPPYAEVTIRPAKMFEDRLAVKQHLERHKILLYYSSILFFGKDVFTQTEISNTLLKENLLVYAQDLFVNGKQYLERFYDHVRQDPGHLRKIETYLKGLKGGSLVPSENFDSRLSAQINDEGQAFYFIQKAARRLYDAEVILKELNPFLSSKVDFALLREDFCKANITFEHFDLLRRAYEQLEEHIDDTRSFFEKNNQVSLLQDLIGEASSGGAQSAGSQGKQGVSSSPSFVKPLGKDLSDDLDESNHTNYRGVEHYNNVVEFVLGKKNTRTLQSVINSVIARKGEAFFADFGAGQGVALQQLKEMFGDQLKTWGIDIKKKTAADMGPIAYRRFIKEYGKEGVEKYLSKEKSFDYIQGDVLDAKVTDGMGRPILMDLITCLYVLQYTKDPFKGWLNMFHQLADGGMLVSQFLFYDNKQGRENLKFYLMIFDKLKEAGVDVEYNWASVTRPIAQESNGSEGQADLSGDQIKKTVERLTGEIVLYVSAARVKGQKINIPIEVLSDKTSDVEIYITEGIEKYSYTFHQVSYKVVGDGVLSVDSRISDQGEALKGATGGTASSSLILTKLVFDDLGILEKYPSFKNSHHCVEASQDIARALKERGIPYFERAVYAPFADSPSAGTLHEIVEVDLDGEIYVVDTQLEQFEDQLGLDENFVKQRVYLADDYYRQAKLYDSPIIEEESLIASPQLVRTRPSLGENASVDGGEFNPDESSGVLSGGLSLKELSLMKELFGDQSPGEFLKMMQEIEAEEDLYEEEPFGDPSIAGKIDVYLRNVQARDRDFERFGVDTTFSGRFSPGSLPQAEERIKELDQYFNRQQGTVEQFLEALKKVKDGALDDRNIPPAYKKALKFVQARAQIDPVSFRFDPSLVLFVPAGSWVHDLLYGGTLERTAGYHIPLTGSEGEKGISVIVVDQNKTLEVTNTTIHELIHGFFDDKQGRDGLGREEANFRVLLEEAVVENLTLEVIKDMLLSDADFFDQTCDDIGIREIWKEEALLAAISRKDPSELKKEFVGKIVQLIGVYGEEREFFAEMLSLGQTPQERQRIEAAVYEFLTRGTKDELVQGVLKGKWEAFLRATPKNGLSKGQKAAFDIFVMTKLLKANDPDDVLKKKTFLVDMALSFMMSESFLEPAQAIAQAYRMRIPEENMDEVKDRVRGYYYIAAQGVLEDYLQGEIRISTENAEELRSIFEEKALDAARMDQMLPRLFVSDGAEGRSEVSDALGSGQVSSPTATGGVDFKRSSMNLERKGEASSAVRFNLSDEDFENMQIDGLYPVIINVTPVTNLPMLLGASAEEEAPQLSLAK